jgi:hypothetical protein
LSERGRETGGDVEEELGKRKAEGEVVADKEEDSQTTTNYMPIKKKKKKFK